jgi:phosphate transport system permease protein
MTDVTSRPNFGQSRVGFHTSAAADARLKARYRAEAIFRGLGLGALLLAGAFLTIFLFTIFREGIPAFFQNYLTLNVELKREDIDPNNTRDPQVIGRADYDAVIRNAVAAQFPNLTDRVARRALSNIVSSGSSVIVRRDVMANPDWIGTRRDIRVPLDDVTDLHMKGAFGSLSSSSGRGEIGISATTGTVQIVSGSNDFAPIVTAIKQQLVGVARRLRSDIAGKERLVTSIEAQIPALTSAVQAAAAGREREEAERLLVEASRSLDQARAERGQVADRLAAIEARIAAVDSRESLDRDLASYFVNANGGVIKLTAVTGRTAEGEVVLPLQSTNAVQAGQWQIRSLSTPESSRKLGDRELVYVESLRERGMVNQSISREFFFGGASREAELAGVGVAIVGSLITLLITLGLSFPIGVAAAVYLEEFAPKNWVTEIIEVNINNLAAVPSIIFGLLGLAVFLNAFGMPRSAPVVGGLVLALMTLPIIIIAARAAIRAVPPSIKEAALGLGASHQQAVFQHVLPLAMPGILTGTILGMAHALGETAPLLMIGMVAFVVDFPKGIADAATLLPVQIFMWADFPEVAFQQKTAAAIIVLLVFLICMNLLAIILRKRFERRW